MGPNLVHSYPNHTKGASSLETGKPTQILGNWLHLSTLSDWHFINLNQSFEDALNLYPRPLEVSIFEYPTQPHADRAFFPFAVFFCEPSFYQSLLFAGVPNGFQPGAGASFFKALS